MLAKDVLTEEWLADVLQDSMEMDWTSTDGARAIMRVLEGGLVELPQCGGQVALSAAPKVASDATPAASSDERQAREDVFAEATRMADTLCEGQDGTQPGLMSAYRNGVRSMALAIKPVLARLAASRPTDTGAGEVAYACASDAACTCYPGLDQSPERQAFCAGAAYNADGSLPAASLATPKPPVDEALREVTDDPVYDRRCGWENDGVVIRQSDMVAAREITAKGRIGYGESIRRGEDFVERVEAVALGHALARTLPDDRGKL